MRLKRFLKHFNKIKVVSLVLDKPKQIVQKAHVDQGFEPNFNLKEVADDADYRKL